MQIPYFEAQYKNVDTHYFFSDIITLLYLKLKVNWHVHQAFSKICISKNYFLNLKWFIYFVEYLEVIVCIINDKKSNLSTLRKQMAHSIQTIKARFREIQKFQEAQYSFPLPCLGLQGEVEGIVSGKVAEWSVLPDRSLLCLH